MKTILTGLYDSLSYGQMISLREHWLAQIRAFEQTKNRENTDKEFKSVDIEDYRLSLHLVAEVSEYLANIVDDRVDCMVDQTDPEAILTYADRVLLNAGEFPHPSEKEKAIAIELLTFLAEEKKNGDAMNILGVLHEAGIVFPSDEKEAAKWYVMGAEAGSAKALVNAGRCYLFGRGISPDDPKAHECLHTALKLGESEALNYIGDMYRDGKYVEKSVSLAAHYYRLGDKFIPTDMGGNGLPVNMARLGETHLFGYDCEVDLSVARIWLQKAWAVFQVQKARGQLYSVEDLARTEALLYELEMKEATNEPAE